MTKLISTGSPFEQTMGYSRAVVKGPWCFVSGVTGYDYATMVMPESAADQARNCFATIAWALDQGGFTMADIVRVQYTVTDAALVEAIRSARRADRSWSEIGTMLGVSKQAAQKKYGKVAV